MVNIPEIPSELINVIIIIVSITVGGFLTYWFQHRFEHKNKRLEIKEKISEAIIAYDIKTAEAVREWYLLSNREKYNFEKYNSMMAKANGFSFKLHALIHLYFKDDELVDDFKTQHNEAVDEFEDWRIKTRIGDTDQLKKISREDHDNMLEKISMQKLIKKLRSAELII